MKIISLKPRTYIWYKFFNSFFTGLSIGSIFTIYAPLKPSIYSVGGILLAVGMLIVAKFYEKLMNIHKFFFISLFVEAVIFLLVIYFLINPYTYMTALLVYAGYQLTFVFGAYLVRAETLIVRKKNLLSIIDIYRQTGYLSGMAGSFLFYKMLEYQIGITSNQDKVYYLHFLLVLVEAVIITVLIRSFKKSF
ncbi:hypothetical protein [Persephonella sp.]